MHFKSTSNIVRIVFLSIDIISPPEKREDKPSKSQEEERGPQKAALDRGKTKDEPDPLTTRTGFRSN